MSARGVAFSFAPTEAHEAPGVVIRRSIGGERLALLDPFLLLDHVTVDPSAQTDVIGFPRHPHRGIETLSWVVAGEVTHKDSIGNQGKVGADGAQWMTAGDGIWHEEMLGAVEGQGEFLQLWFSLPREQKRLPAAYAGAPTVPWLTPVEGVKVGVVAGRLGEAHGAFTGIAVNPLVLDVQITAGVGYTLELEPVAHGFVYALRGSVHIGGRVLTAPEMGVLTGGESVKLEAGEEGARLFVCAAKPLFEPVVQYRSFVMNTVEDIAETVAMFQTPAQ